HDASLIARQLAQLGAKVHPENEELQKINRILNSKGNAKTHPSRGGFKQAMLWLGDHGAQYRGLWVAVSRNGEFLGSASTLEELIEQLGNPETLVDILTTWIP